MRLSSQLILAAVTVSALAGCGDTTYVIRPNPSSIGGVPTVPDSNEILPAAGNDDETLAKIKELEAKIDELNQKIAEGQPEGGTTGGSTTGGEDSAELTVVGTYPAKDATNITPDLMGVGFTMSKPVDGTSVTKDSIVIVPTPASASSVNISGNPNVLFVLGKDNNGKSFLPNTLYTVTLKAGIKDTDGNTLATDYTWSFTTGAPTDGGKIANPAIVNPNEMIAPAIPRAGHCGNGLLDGAEGEACDDGNRNNGDGCSSTCQSEPGWVCDGGSDYTPCWRACGDGIVEPGEECDDGNAAGWDGCSSCKVDVGWECQSGNPSVCRAKF